MHIKYLFGSTVLPLLLLFLYVWIEVAYIFEECKDHKQIKHTTA